MRIFAGAALAATLAASVAAGAPAGSAQRVLATGGPVTALAADGSRVTFVVRAGRESPCAGVKLWEPLRARVVRLQRPCPSGDNNGEGTFGIALAGTRAAWLWTAGGNTLESNIMTATLAHPKPVFVISGAADHSGVGTFARSPVGGGGELAFTFERRCDPYGDPGEQCPPGKKAGTVIAASVWRIGGTSHCVMPGGLPLCSRVADAAGELTVLAVDSGRIAVRTANAVTLMTAGGRPLREFPVKAHSAALSANRIAVRTATAVAVYDTETAQLVKRFLAAKSVRLQDLDRDLLVTASNGTVTVRQLGTDNKATLRPGGTALAQLERSGLFIAAHGRLTFTPMPQVLRLVGG
jgi:hypothetical protein